MKKLCGLLLIASIFLGQLLPLTSVYAQNLSEGCEHLNGMATQDLSKGESFGTVLAFGENEVITVTADLDSATNAQFVILDKINKPIVGPTPVPGTLMYPIPFNGKFDFTFANSQQSNGSITLDVRCLPGNPLAVSPTNPFAAGSKALINDLSGSTLPLMSSPNNTATTITNLPTGTPIMLTLEPLSIKNALWYRVRTNQIEGWITGKLSSNGTQIDSLIPYSEQALTQTVSALSDAIHSNPTSAALLSRANIYYGKQHDDQALADLIEAIKIDPENATGYYLRGLINLQQKNTTDALENFTSALRLSPKDPVLYNMRGSVYDSVKNESAALDDFSSAIQLNPKFATAYYNRGSVYQALGSVGQAIGDFSQTLEIDTLYARAYLSRSVVVYSQNKDDKTSAIIALNQTIKAEPTDSVAYANRGDIYTRLANYIAAFADYSKAIDLDPNNILTYYNMGVTYEAMGKHEAAAESFNKLIQLSTTNDMCLVCEYYNIGIAYFNSGDNDKAIENYTMAIKLVPNFANAYTNRAQAYTAQGNADAAQADQKKAADLIASGQAVLPDLRIQ